MIDIHAHIIPGIDDGSQDIETSLEMLAMAQSSGVSSIVATPHCNIPGVYDNFLDDTLRQRFIELEHAKRMAGLQIHIYRGMEIFATEALPKLLSEHKAWTYNGTRYFLTEFSFGEDPAFCNEILHECVRLGYHPIIAHPERYYFVQRDPYIAYDWRMKGYGLQINRGSITGRFGKKEQETAQLLLEHGLVACIASDAHGVIHRTAEMTDVEDQIFRGFGPDYANLVFYENPKRMLQGKELLGLEPIPIG